MFFCTDPKLAANLCKHAVVEINLITMILESNQRHSHEFNYAFIWICCCAYWIHMVRINYTHLRSSVCNLTGFTSHFLGKIILLWRSILLVIGVCCCCCYFFCLSLSLSCLFFFQFYSQLSVLPYRTHMKWLILVTVEIIQAKYSGNIRKCICIILNALAGF